MTELLEKAFAAASKLPSEEQDVVAALLLQEMASEQRWQAAFANSQEALATLAAEALAEHRRGETEPLDPESF